MLFRKILLQVVVFVAAFLAISFAQYYMLGGDSPREIGIKLWDHVVFSPIKPETDVVYWWIEEDNDAVQGSVIIREKEEEIIIFEDITKEIEYMLNHDDGWAKAGLYFQRTRNRDEAQLLIYLFDSEKDLFLFCRTDGVAGCVRNIDGIANRGNKVSMGVHLPALNGLSIPQDLYIFSKNFTLSIVNHEAGHALLGAGHSEYSNDLTAATGDMKDTKEVNGIMFPSAREIERLKSRLSNL